MKANLTTELKKENKMEITFNTGRGYSSDGQVIKAHWVGNGYKDMDAFYTDYLSRPSAEYNPLDDPYVIFEDLTRSIKGKITLCDLDQDEIMEAYDNGRYTDI